MVRKRLKKSFSDTRYFVLKKIDHESFSNFLNSYTECTVSNRNIKRYVTGRKVALSDLE